MTTTADLQNQLEAALKEGREIAARIAHLREEETIAQAEADHLEKRIVAESRDPVHGVPLVRIRDIAEADSKLKSIASRLATHKRKQYLLESKIESLKESLAQHENDDKTPGEGARQSKSQLFPDLRPGHGIVLGDGKSGAGCA